MKGVPPRRAIRVPTTEPMMLAAAIGSANSHRMLPVGTKNEIAATLVARFTTLEAAEARRKSSPKKRTNRKIRKLPVPGPKKPS